MRVGCSAGLGGAVMLTELSNFPVRSIAENKHSDRRNVADRFHANHFNYCASVDVLEFAHSFLWAVICTMLCVRRERPTNTRVNCA